MRRGVVRISPNEKNITSLFLDIETSIIWVEVYEKRKNKKVQTDSEDPADQIKLIPRQFTIAEILPISEKKRNELFENELEHSRRDIWDFWFVVNTQMVHVNPTEQRPFMY